MTIETKKMTEAVGRTLKYAAYSRSDIEKLILADVEAKGLHSKDSKVTISTNTRYVDDKDGTNKYVQMTFDKAMVNLSD